MELQERGGVTVIAQCLSRYAHYLSVRVLRVGLLVQLQPTTPNVCVFVQRIDSPADKVSYCCNF